MAPIAPSIYAGTLFFCVPALAQEVITVPDAVSCPRCVISLERVVTLDGRTGPGAQYVSDEPIVAIDRRGRVLVSRIALPMATEIAVFDSTGSFLRTVGRSGDGPGEYRSIVHINVDEEHIHVFDLLSRRRTLLDHDFEVVATHRVRGQVMSSVVLSREEILFFANVPLPAQVARPLHILNLAGELESFGEDGSVYRGYTSRLVVGGSAARLWSLEGMTNRLVEWDVRSRRPVRIIERRVDWFDREPRDTWPTTGITSIREDAAGLWIVGVGPDSRWTERRRVEAGGPFPDVPRQDVIDGWLELVDPGTGRTIARTRVDHGMLWVPGSDLLAVLREDDLGFPHVDLVRARLVEPPGQSNRRR